MNILFLLSRIEKSGVTLHSIDLAEGLIQKGHSLTIITGGMTDPNNSYLKSLYSKLMDLDVRILEFKTPKGNIFSKVYTSLSSIFRIVRWIKGGSWDVIHSQSPYMTFLPWLSRKKFVTTVHNVQLKPNIKYKKPTELIAISTESKQYAIDHMGAAEKHTTVVCHGISKRFSETIDQTEKLSIKNVHGLPTDKLIIGFVGRITEEKGLGELIEATSLLKKTIRDQVHLVFLGDYYEKEDKSRLQQQIDAAEINGQITIIPFQDPLPLYQIFDIFVLPSKSEAFGLVCVEAMMAGCATLRTDTNGALDQISHGIDGYIYPSGKSDILAPLLEKLVEDPKLREEIGKKGRQTALGRFSLEAMTQNTLEVYQKTRQK